MFPFFFFGSGFGLFFLLPSTPPLSHNIHWLLDFNTNQSNSSENAVVFLIKQKWMHEQCRCFRFLFNSRIDWQNVEVLGGSESNRLKWKGRTLEAGLDGGGAVREEPIEFPKLAAQNHWKTNERCREPNEIRLGWSVWSWFYFWFLIL